MESTMSVITAKWPKTRIVLPIPPNYFAFSQEAFEQNSIESGIPWAEWYDHRDSVTLRTEFFDLDRNLCVTLRTTHVFVDKRTMRKRLSLEKLQKFLESKKIS